MRREFRLVLVLLAVGSAVALGQTTVKADQGKPGTQGCWPVCTSGSTTIATDGGSLGSVATYPIACRGTAADGGAAEFNTVVGGTTTQVPASPSAGRVYVNICNSAQNASTAIVKCRQDGVAPVFAAGNPGQVLLFGDCLLSTAPTTANAIQCIADAAGRNVTTFECVP